MKYTVEVLHEHEVDWVAFVFCWWGLWLMGASLNNRYTELTYIAKCKMQLRQLTDHTSRQCFYVLIILNRSLKQGKNIDGDKTGHQWQTVVDWMTWSMTVCVPYPANLLALSAGPSYPSQLINMYFTMASLQTHPWATSALYPVNILTSSIVLAFCEQMYAPCSMTPHLHHTYNSRYSL